MEEFKKQLILQITNGVVTKTGVDINPMFLEGQANAILQLADKIIEKMDEKDK